MLWITRSRVHIDRVACPWLIRRFVDSDAKFLFVPANQVELVAKKEGAIAFDVPGCELGHYGSKCSFDAIMEKYGLVDKALARLARVVNAADTDNHDRDPVAPGIDAISTGMGLMFCDDSENIEAQFTIYDALYAWCKLEVAKGQSKPKKPTKSKD